ncbi:hypothetical protein [Allosphingosinicella indica]|uniref:hypothetical protein n=1 Tax=Allosphingosinicella indica TaxID=941907 RepID=UPI000A14C1B0|nr:hypothetical protein [Allosphingosinicella indica]
MTTTPPSPKQQLHPAPSGADYLREQAARSRRLAASTPDRDLANRLNAIADDFDREARAIDRRS